MKKDAAREPAAANAEAGGTEKTRTALEWRSHLGIPSYVYAGASNRPGFPEGPMTKKRFLAILEQWKTAPLAGR